MNTNNHIISTIFHMVETTKNTDCLAILAGAVNAEQYVLNADLDSFTTELCKCISVATTLGYDKEGVGEFARRFCGLCGIDPMLIQAYVGSPLYWVK